METLIETESLSFKGILSYPDIVIPKNKVTFLSGASGCGKSTLFKLFNGTISPDTGRILYQGQDISNWNKVELRRKVLLVKQVPYLFRGSIQENFSTFHTFHESNSPSPSEISDLLDLCCMSTNTQASCDTMSGGEQQRIFLSIALSFMPEVLLLDEPTSALNTELSRQIIENIIAFTKQKNISLLIISHDADLQSLYAEHVIALRRAQ